MAQSRLEKIGTIFSRLQGLRKSGAIKAEQVDLVVWVAICNLQVPIWAQVYEAFPPRYEPRWDAKDPVEPVRKILYREDSVRAQYSKVLSPFEQSFPGEYISFSASKVFGDNERIDLFSDTKLGSERFVEKFLAIQDSGEVAPEQVLIIKSNFM